MAIKNKTKMIGFRATREEKRLIVGAAKKLSLRMSSYVRLCVLSDIANRETLRADRKTREEEISRKWAEKPKSQPGRILLTAAAKGEA